MIIDHFTKYMHFISFREEYDSEQLRYIFMNWLIRYHEILKELTSDKNKLFTLKYWQTFVSMLKVRLCLFTTYHSRTDEQTERINQTLKQYLRHYINYHQDNWVKLLSMTQIAMNSKISDTIKISSYFVNFERELNLFEQEQQQVSTDFIMNWIKRFKNIRDNIQKMQLKSEKYVNKKRKKDPQLKEKDKVYLLTKNLTTKRLMKKLNHIKIESFFIKAVKGSVSYELSLSKNIRIHSIFHINLLKSADLSTFIQENFHFENSEDEYIVKGILNRKGQQYLIKWKDYFHSDNTWKSFKNLTSCQKLLKEFHQKKKLRITRQK